MDIHCAPAVETAGYVYQDIFVKVLNFDKDSVSIEMEKLINQLTRREAKLFFKASAEI